MAWSFWRRARPRGRACRQWAIVLALAYCCAAPAYASKLTIEQPCFGTVRGPIDNDTVQQVRGFIGTRANECLMFVFFDSNGGDVHSALTVGAMLREIGAFTTVRPRAVCASACVFAFLGGASRTVVGTVGLHRPFPLVGSASVAEAESRRRRLDADVHDYLVRMRIPHALQDAINSVPSSDMAWLDGSNPVDREKLDRLGISGDDPVWTEVRDTGRAKDLGIDLPEFYRRRQRASALCTPPDPESKTQVKAWATCHEEVMAGRR